MKSYSWVVISRAKAASLEEFERWYDGTHLPEVCAIPGVTGARRYRVESQTALACSQPAWDSVAIYEFSGDDPTSITQAIMAAWGSGRMTLTDMMAPEGVQIVVSHAASA